MVGVAGVLGVMDVFVTEIVHYFGKDNSKRRMSCSCIRMGFIMGMLYVLVRIFEGIGHRDIIHLCYYNNNHSSGSRNNMNWISNENIIGF